MSINKALRRARLSSVVVSMGSLVSGGLLLIGALVGLESGSSSFTSHFTFTWCWPDRVVFVTLVDESGDNAEAPQKPDWLGNGIGIGIGIGIGNGIIHGKGNMRVGGGRRDDICGARGGLWPFCIWGAVAKGGGGSTLLKAPKGNTFDRKSKAGLGGWAIKGGGGGTLPTDGEGWWGGTLRLAWLLIGFRIRVATPVGLLVRGAWTGLCIRLRLCRWSLNSFELEAGLLSVGLLLRFRKCSGFT